MLPTATATSPSRTFAYRQRAWFSARAAVSRSSRDVWAQAASTTLCAASARYVHPLSPLYQTKRLLTSPFQAEKALDWTLARINDERKKPFGKLLSEHGMMLERIARSRIEIDAARLVVLNAAIKIDESNAKGALKEIAEAKVLVPTTMLTVIDRAIQAYGGAGVCQDTPLANMYAQGRTMRIVDGPDEVHILQLGKNENKRGKALFEKIEWQKRRGAELCREHGMEKRDVLQLDRQSGVNKPRL